METSKNKTKLLDLVKTMVLTRGERVWKWKELVERLGSEMTLKF